MATKLEESQAKLDALLEKITENKAAREKLREEARELRDQYIAEEKIREAELKSELTGGAN